MLFDTGSATPTILVNAGRTNNYTMIATVERFLWAPYTTSHDGRSASWRQLCSYSYLWSTQLFPDKYFLQTQFFEWLQHQHAEDKVLCGQRNRLLRKDVVRVRNSHLWTRYAPHVIRERKSRTHFNVSVCARTVWDFTVMSSVLPNRLTAQRDHNFVLIIVPRLLEDVLLAVSQHDGALGHCRESVWQWLKATCPGRWMGYVMETEDTVCLLGRWI